MRTRPALPCTFGLLLAGCTGEPKAGESGETGGDELVEAILSLDGVTSVDELEPVTPATRFLRIGFEQPVDHADPGGATFTQWLNLVFRDTGAPVVLDTRGYGNSYSGLDNELSRLVSGNRLNVEHRFFAPSAPDPLDWSLLRVEQATADLHAVTTSLQALFSGPWVATGASKGGVNALLYRAAYPDDVVGTVAYVAPFNQGLPDDGYLSFFDTVGEADCRASLLEMQRTLLENRAALVERTEAEAAALGETFSTMDADTAFQVSASELAWTFWQYDGDCASLPGDTSDVDAVWDWFLASYDPPFTYADATNAYYAPYYYQCAAETGYPSQTTAGFGDLLTADPNDITPLLPEPVDYDPAVVDAAAEWLSTEGDTLLLISGEQDPWSVRRLVLDGATDSFAFLAPGANHGASLVDLESADQAVALDAISRWTGLSLSTARLARVDRVDVREEGWPGRRGE